MDSYISQGYLCDVKYNQPRLGFELVIPSSFPTIGRYIWNEKKKKK